MDRHLVKPCIVAINAWRRLIILNAIKGKEKREKRKEKREKRREKREE
jgi:hypothetical protein